MAARARSHRRASSAAAALVQRARLLATYQCLRPTWPARGSAQPRKQEAIPPVAVANVSGKFIPADSSCNDRAHLYHFPEQKRDYTLRPQRAMAPKLDQRSRDAALIEIARSPRGRGRRISCHKQARLARTSTYTLNTALG